MTPYALDLNFALLRSEVAFLETSPFREFISFFVGPLLEKIFGRGRRVERRQSWSLLLDLDVSFSSDDSVFSELGL